MSIYVYSATSKTLPLSINGEIVQATYYKYTHNQSLENDYNWFGEKSKGIFSKIKYWADRALSKAKRDNVKYVIVGDDEYPDFPRSVFKVSYVDDLSSFIWDHDPNHLHTRLGSYQKSKIGKRVVYLPLPSSKGNH
ncbi:MAG: hypothetical protein DRN27_08760 [Thermoplasmata archaeon]|nr:MAG: hypothetical protein DRN27_08760 [Thermoplasmata archaeon]